MEKHQATSATPLIVDHMTACILYDRWIADVKPIVEENKLCPDCYLSIALNLDQQIRQIVTYWYKEDKKIYFQLLDAMPNFRNDILKRMSDGRWSGELKTGASQMLYAYEIMKEEFGA